MTTTNLIHVFNQSRRDYGIRSALNITQGLLRHIAIRQWVRVGMKLTGTELGLADVWDDFYRDNIPESWEEYEDDKIEDMQDGLLLFIQNDVNSTLLDDLFKLR